MKYSLESLMIVVGIVPPLLALAWFFPEIAALAIVLFSPLLLLARFRLWGLFSSLAFGWGIVYLVHANLSSVSIHSHLMGWFGFAYFVILCLPFYVVVLLFTAGQRKSY